MATSNGSSTGTKITALVVDDDRVINAIHCKLLNKLGIENHVAANGKEAVDLHCSGKKFDLILMDRDMPIMNGIEATRELRAMGVRSIIVGVSTRSIKQEIQEFMDSGLDDYQEKPLTSSKDFYFHQEKTAITLPNPGIWEKIKTTKKKPSRMKLVHNIKTYSSG